MRTGITVADAMTKMPVTVQDTVSIKECAQMMRDHGVGSLLVKKGDDIVGIVTEKDFVLKVLAEDTDKNEPISTVMSTKMISIDPDQDLYDAMMLMRDENVRRLPVMHKGKLAGMLTANDIVKIEPQLFDYLSEKMKIREEHDKLRMKSGSEGLCELCGRNSRLFEHNKQMVCRMCS